MNIVRISTEQAAVGMITATDIFAKNKLLIEKDTELNERSLIRLKLYGINELKVYHTEDMQNIILNDEEVKGLITNYQGNVDTLIQQEKNKTVTEDSPYRLEIRSTKEFQRFSHAIINYANNLKSYLNRIIETNEQLDTKKMIAEVEAIIMESRNGLHVIDMMNCMRNYDDDTYIHSINVSILCYVMGRWLNYSLADTRILALSGLLHDIGKLMIPHDLISKPSELTEEEYIRVKEHANKGYFILKQQNLDVRIKNVALMHHEKCDGSGYPLGLTREQIEPFAKIVAIADIFEAMTAKRVYRGPVCPFEVVSIFEKEGLRKYDPAFLLTFLERVIESYIHNWVLLSNKVKAEIIMINKFDLTKPVVRTQDSNFIDLSKERNLDIMAII